MSETLVYVADAAELSDDALFRQVLESAPPERRARAERFRFRRDKQLGNISGLMHAKGHRIHDKENDEKADTAKSQHRCG